jgi:hypothetical protein
LNEFAKANVLALIKSTHYRWISEPAIKTISHVVKVEHDLHVQALHFFCFFTLLTSSLAKYCSSWGISREDLENTEESTTCMAYTRFVMEKGLTGDILDLRVAMAACIIGYGEVGLWMRGHTETKKGQVFFCF